MFYEEMQITQKKSAWRISFQGLQSLRFSAIYASTSLVIPDNQVNFQNFNVFKLHEALKDFVQVLWSILGQFMHLLCCNLIITLWLEIYLNKFHFFSPLQKNFTIKQNTEHFFSLDYALQEACYAHAALWAV